MKSKKRKIGDSGIRLKPNEPNILENYTKYRKRSKKTKKRKPKRKKKTVKHVEIKEKKDPLLQIVEESKNKPKEEIVVEEGILVAVTSISTANLLESATVKLVLELLVVQDC